MGTAGGWRDCGERRVRNTSVLSVLTTSVCGNPSPGLTVPGRPRHRAAPLLPQAPPLHLLIALPYLPPQGLCPRCPSTSTFPG